MKILLHLEMMRSKNIWNFLIPGGVILDAGNLDAEDSIIALYESETKNLVHSNQ
jgi:hypothetical protein